MADREEVKAAVDELMRRYGAEEIDAETYFREMMELTTTARNSEDLPSE